MSHPTRRQWLAAAALGAAALPRPAAAIEPIQRPGRNGKLRLSLAAYSFNRLLRLNAKTRPEMTLPQFIDFAAPLPLDAVELTAYYFPETTPKYLASLKRQCTLLGLDVSGTAVGNDFCVKDPGERKKQIESVKQWVEHTSRLGGKTIRIFAGRLPKGDSEQEALKRCVEAIHEACDHAGKYGIFLALENHGGITSTVEQMLAIVESVKHDWFGVNLDSGNFRTADPYGDLAKIAPYAVNAQLKTEIQKAGSKKEEADLGRLIEMLRSVNYRGYVALEYEGAEDPHKAVPRYIAELRRLIG